MRIISTISAFCCKTRKFIERYINLETTYVPLSKCELPSDVIDLALNDLYITDGEKTWLGYSSYIKLLSLPQFIRISQYSK